MKVHLAYLDFEIQPGPTARACEQVASGVELLDPSTGEPTAAAYGLMAVSLLLPLVLASEALSGVVGVLQALAGGSPPPSLP